MATRSSLQPELMDDPGLALDATEQALRDIETVHRWVGNRALWRLLLPALAAGPRHQLLLDVGTGNGAVAAEARRHAARRGVEASPIGLDRKLSHLSLGSIHGHRQLRVVGDALALPFADGAVEVSFSTLFQHHFLPGALPAAGAQVLAEMRRVSRRAAIVVDIRRSSIGGLLGRLLLNLLRAGPIARYDGRLSLDQSWTLDEVRRAVPPGTIRSLARRWPFRWALELLPGGAEGYDSASEVVRQAPDSTV